MSCISLQVSNFSLAFSTIIQNRLNIIWGPPRRQGPLSRRQMRRTGEKWVGVPISCRLGGLGDRHKLHQRGPGGFGTFGIVHFFA